MNFTIELTASPALLDAIKNLTLAFQGQSAPVEASELKKPVSTKTKAVDSIPDKIKPILTAPDPVVVEKPDATETTEVTEKEIVITLEDLRALVRTKAQAGHRDAIKACLVASGAENVTNLEKDKYAEFKANVEAL